MPKVIVFEVRGVQVPKEHLEAQAFLDPFFAQLKEEVKKSRHTRIVSGYEDNLRNLGEGMLWALPAHSRTMSGSLGNPHWIPSDAEMGDDLRDLVPTAQINVFLPYLPPLRLINLICSMYDIPFSEEEKEYPFGTFWVINLDRGQYGVLRVDLKR